jgi:septum formation protein
MPDDSRPPDIVLASGSPRRKELLERLCVSFVVDPGDVAERSPDPGDDPAEFALELAQVKAAAGARSHPDSLVIGADTVVTIDDLILGKPHDVDHALEMLQQLRAASHRVVTAVAVCVGPACRRAAVTSDVWMKRATDEELRAYIATGEPMDKAGGYGLQGLGGQLVERVVGCYNNVVGLPLCLTSRLMTERGFEIKMPDGVDPHTCATSAKTPLF